MLIPLKDIELYFDDELVEQAEQLMSDGCVRSIREIEKNLWVAYIEKGEIFETEAIVTHHKIKAFTCECTAFKTKHICSHSICMLLSLRQQKTIHQLKSAPKIDPKSETLGKDNLKDMLLATSHIELVSFIAEYAKKDAKLALLLKSRFISTVGIKDPLMAFRSLIESVSKPLYQHDSASNNQASLHLKALMMQLFKNAENDVRNGNFDEVFGIIAAIYAELLKLHTKRIFPKLYAPLVHKTLVFLIGLYQQSTSIALKNKIWEQCFPIKISFFDQFQCLESFYTKLILPLSHTIHKEEVLVDFLDSQISLFANQSEIKNQLVVYKMMAVFQMGQDHLFDQLLKDHSDSISLLYYSAIKAYENGQWELAGNLLRKTISNGAEGEQKNEIEELLFRVSLEIKDDPSIYIYGQKRLIATMDPAYYNLLKAHQCGEKLLHQIIQELELLPALRSRNHCLAKIYLIENDLEKLKKLVYSLQSLDLMILYDTKLSLHDDEILNTYKTFIRQYLYHHLGRQASHRIILVILHLKGTARLSMAKDILQMLILEYPERHTLMEELKNIA